jgi:pSer/pThr/pTyr-binding forkhead associated (FHA) protein
MEPREQRGHRFTLANVLTIGRDPDCDIAMPDDQFMSGRHAKLEIRPDGAWLVDLNSTNGCLVNGRRIHGERQLRAGDRVQTGNSVLETRR